METLSRAFSVIQQDILRNNPGHVKDSVNEASEVLSRMLNTHKCLLESGVEIQKNLESRLKKDGYLPETALCVSGRYPKKLTKEEKGVAPSHPEDRLAKKGKGGISSSYTVAITGQKLRSSLSGEPGGRRSPWYLKRGVTFRPSRRR